MITVAKVEELIKTASDRVEWIVTPISKAKDMLEAAEEVREVSVEGLSITMPHGYCIYK